MLNDAVHIRRELMIRVVRAFDDGTLADELDRIPVRLRPRKGEHSRCCVYHDRAVLKYRLMALMGILPADETDEAVTLKEYISSGTDSVNPVKSLGVCGAACSRCPSAKVVSTPNCRGCFARPCQHACPKGAIAVVDGQSVIDQSKCVKCGKCITVCPFHAIVRTTVPCEEACPVGAIKKNPDGEAQIDYARCIMCGKCFAACPFGAVLERSRLVELLEAMKRGEKIVAMVAPSCEGQFPGKIEQLLAACAKAGFADVMEVALGAEVTTANETREFLERMKENPKTLMTTSCCPAYVNLARKHVPELLPRVSTTLSPMLYARDLAKAKDPQAKTCFIGPCVAKRGEAAANGVDYVLTFEELGALLAGRGVDVMSCEPWPVPRPASATARNYARSCGVTEAVLTEAAQDVPDFKLDAKQISGIDRKTAMQLKLYALGKLPGNFLEVMACPGGCRNGPVSLCR